MAALGGGAGAWLGSRSIGEDREIRSLIDTYQKTGKIPDLDGLRQQFVARECKTLGLSAAPDAVDEASEAFHQHNIRRFLDGTQAEFLRIVAQRDGIQPGTALSIIDHINILKLAFEKQYLPETKYNSAYDSIVHVPCGRLQCRSATYLFLLALKSNLESSLQNGEQFVVVYSATEPDQVGHIVPGVVTAGGDIVTFEMTELGSKGHYLGRIDDPPRNIRVRSADAALALAALGFLDKKLLADTVADHEHRSNVVRGNFPEPFSLGTNHGRLGDQPLTRITPEVAKEQQQYLSNVLVLRKLAETDRVAQGYLKILPTMMKFRERLLGLPNVSARFESLSTNQLTKLRDEVAALNREVEAFYDRNRDMAGLYIAAKLGVEDAATEFKQRVEEQSSKKDVDKIKSRMMFFDLPGKRADVDPVYAVVNEIYRKDYKIWEYLNRDR